VGAGSNYLGGSLYGFIVWGDFVCFWVGKRGVCFFIDLLFFFSKLSRLCISKVIVDISQGGIPCHIIV
jgi:hypothetical protein